MLPIAIIPIISIGLGIGTYFVTRSGVEEIVIGRWLEIVASVILLVGLKKTKKEYKSAIMLFWLASSSVLVLAVLFSLRRNSYYGKFTIPGNIALVIMMVIIYKEYLHLTEEEDTSSSWRLSISHNPKLVLIVTSLVVPILAISTFISDWYRNNSPLKSSCILAFSMSEVLIFAIFLAKSYHFGSVLFAWFTTTYGLFIALIFDITRDKEQLFFSGTADLIILAAMYVVYKAYVQMEKNQQEENSNTKNEEQLEELKSDEQKLPEESPYEIYEVAE